MSLYIYIYFHHFLRQVEKNLEQTENEKSFILKLPTCRFHYVSMFFQLLSIVQLLRCRKFVQALIEKNLWYTMQVRNSNNKYDDFVKNYFKGYFDYYTEC